MKLRVLNADSIRQLLSVERCIPLMRHALRMVADGQALQPIRQRIAQPDGRGTLGIMPGYTAEPRWLGIKAVSVFPGNFGTDLGSHQGVVLLFDTTNGAPRAMLDGREITAIRTAAATAAATDVLAVQGASTLGIFGYGEQAHTHAAALMAVRRFREIIIWGRDPARAAAFAEKLREELGQRAGAPQIVRATARPEEAAQADVICTVTAAKEPFYRAAWLRAGQHLNLVGSSIPAACEADPEVVARSRYFVDFKDSALALASEFRRARDAGLVGEEHIIGSVGEVMAGTVRGRTSDTDITLFKSLGMVAEDLVTADYLLSEAERQNKGQLIDW